MDKQQVTQSWQNRFQAQQTYLDTRPEWAALALAVVNRWGREEATLVHAVAEALEAAYQAGVAGEYPEPPAPPAIQRIRRVRPSATEPDEPAPTRIRRTRQTVQKPKIFRRSR